MGLHPHSRATGGARRTAPPTRHAVQPTPLPEFPPSGQQNWSDLMRRRAQSRRGAARVSRCPAAQ
eukprot:scaffold171324_cov24-Tisochrysis_lutea.AAC.2